MGQVFVRYKAGQPHGTESMCMVGKAHVYFEQGMILLCGTKKSNKCVLIIYKNNYHFCWTKSIIV